MVVEHFFPFFYRSRAPLVQIVVKIDREVFLDLTFEHLSRSQALDIVNLSGVEGLQFFNSVVSERHNDLCKYRYALNIDAG